MDAGDRIYLMPSIQKINTALAGKTLDKKHNYNTQKLEELVAVFSRLTHDIHDIHDFVLHLPYPELTKESK